ncbi:MAG: DNA primase [Terriglobales bacterium]
MASSGDFAHTVKHQADIVRIVGEYVKLRKAGGQNWVGLCPFHQEKTGSFSVHQTRQFYHCFGCGESGDVFKFIQKIENITFLESVRFIAAKLGITIPKTTFNSEAEAKEARLRGALLDIHERACVWFQEQLRRPEAAHAREYLAGRGLNEHIIAQFRIGYAPDSGFLLRDALRREFSEELLRASGLFSWKETVPAPPSPTEDPEHATENGKRKTENDAYYARFRNRVMFPICNESGRIIAFTGRTLARDEKHGPKYLNSPETPIYSKSHVLFNLHKAKDEIRKREYAILVEGQMDCISVYAAGIPNVIASSGTAFTEAQARLLARYSKNIVVNFDPDAAGAAAAERSLALLVEQEFQIKVMTLEEGYDPDLFIRAKGLDEYVAVLRRAPKYFDYLIERARARFPRTPEGKDKAVRFLLPFVQRVPSRIARDELANEIAQKLGIDSAVLRQELKHAAVARGAVQNRIPVAPVTLAERILVRALASQTEMLAGDSESARDGSDGLFDPAQEARLVFASERLHEGLACEPLVEALLKADGSDPMSLPLADSDRNLLADILMHEHEQLTPELLESSVHALRHKKQLALRDSELRARIADAERRQDMTELLRLKQEKLELDRTLAVGR